VLTVDFDRLGVRPGDRVLDVGCGAGRHAFELYRRGADVVALDRDQATLRDVGEMFAAMRTEKQAPANASARTVHGDALALPFPDAHFDHVVAAEILEHLPHDERAIAEVVRVLRPGGGAAVSVPRWWPERVCWALSRAYHEVDGGHVRIYTGRVLDRRLAAAGLHATGREHAHGLHAPYWWIKCAVGVDHDDHPLARLYHRLLVWDLTRRPWPTRTAERVLNPLCGKSLVLYLRKPVVETGRAAA
jgi:SAM-dependent methyltransferase